MPVPMTHLIEQARQASQTADDLHSLLIALAVGETPIPQDLARQIEHDLGEVLGRLDDIADTVAEAGPLPGVYAEPALSH